MTTSGFLFLLCFLILSEALFSVAKPQSRRIAPLPSPSPTSSPRPFLQKGSDPKQSHDNSIDTYIFVFSADLPFSGFTDKLNRTAEQGYRLASATYGWQRLSGEYYRIPVAILRIDEGQYEYAWFETTNNRFFALAGSEGKYEGFLKQGFHLFEHSLLSMYCEYIDADNIVYGETCESRHLFLLEKQKGVDRPKQYRLVLNTPRWRSKRITAELLGQLNDRIRQGFYPTHLLSKYEILVEQAPNRTEPFTEKPNLQVVRDTSAWGQDNLPKNVNESAKQGYRLALVSDGIAVMYRTPETTGVVSYVWLDAKKKNFEQELALLEARGAVYRMAYPYIQGVKSQLIFEQPSVADGQRREYRVLKFDFQIDEDSKPKNGAQQNVLINLTPASKQTVKLMNRLAKDGFIVRDLFVSDKVSVLLERSP